MIPVILSNRLDFAHTLRHQPTSAKVCLLILGHASSVIGFDFQFSPTYCEKEGLEQQPLVRGSRMEEKLLSYIERTAAWKVSLIFELLPFLEQKSKLFNYEEPRRVFFALMRTSVFLLSDELGHSK